MIEDYDNVDYDYFKEWDIEQYKQEIERLKQEIDKLVDTIEDVNREFSQYKYEKNKEIERLKEDYLKEKYLVDKYTRQLTDEYKNTEYQCKEKERLNNIINELEDYMIGKDIYKILLYKLRDLKEGDFE